MIQLIVTCLACIWLHRIEAVSDPDRTHVFVPGVGNVTCSMLPSGVVVAKGIRYAVPPTGSRRFRKSLPAPPLLDIDATSYGHACMQQDAPAYYHIDEDCLFLNVHIPPATLARRKPLQGWPVFFWIHGGAFVVGSGMDYDGETFAKQGVLVVTINYRLGFLAFTPLPEVKVLDGTNGGMNGILDQALALRWVHDHIEYFGGDPTSVTIGGQSAGAVSTELHMRLPLSAGLFKRAIIQSGFHFVLSANSPAGGMNATVFESKVAAMMNKLNVTDLAGMQNVNASDFLSFAQYGQMWPQIDEHYFPRFPNEMDLTCSDCDVIIGVDEQDSPIAPPYIDYPSGGPLDKVIPSKPEQLQQMLSIFMGPEVLGVLPKIDANASEDKIRSQSFYAGSHLGMACSTQMLADELHKRGNNVFFYSFGYWPAEGDWRGMAPHGGELSFTWGYKAGLFCDGCLDRFFDAGLAKTMSGYWSSFISTGTPSGLTSWSPYTLSDQSPSILQITQDDDDKPLVINANAPHYHAECTYVRRLLRTNTTSGFDESNNVIDWLSFGGILVVGLPPFRPLPIDPPVSQSVSISTLLV